MLLFWIVGLSIAVSTIVHAIAGKHENMLKFKDFKPKKSKNESASISPVEAIKFNDNSSEQEEDNTEGEAAYNAKNRA